MGNIISFIAQNTDGYSYKSFKYCFESYSVPHIQYDENTALVIKRYGETEKIRTTRDLTRLQSSGIIKEPLFRFFLDGSRRTYKVDDLGYGRRLYPAVAGQIGIACCERNDKDNFKSRSYINNLVLSIPTEANSGSHNSDQYFNRLLAKLNEQPFIQKRNLQFSKILNYDVRDGDEYEKKAIAEIQNEMVDREKRLVHSLALERALTTNSYLMKDGSLEYPIMSSKGDFSELSKIKSNYSCVVGVSKAFNPETVSSTVPDIAKIIAGLPLNHRTPAIKYSTARVGDVWFSVWYVRIRDIKYCQGPYDGVLKIEKILVSDIEIENGLHSEEIDLISANIINESFPVCYGQDDRWAKHLYPIFLTEQFIKSKYLSDVHFINLF